ncbi:hypothetical protein BDN70DRAFT_995197 [Pholiota conissans]|uniref:Uncharacterized protein n=1 Tax=Pholiota conissans TaxID=109636 RepID=A0A9P5YWR2_9AGAR|nr:hypothetical protein BDN70DRAFT_995197 [Pholiota conissans]
MLPDSQNVGATFASALFYGLYLTTLFHCLRWLAFTDDGWSFRKQINWPMLSITLILFGLLTLSRAINLQNTMSQVDGEGYSKPGEVFTTTRLTWMAVVTCTDANVSTLLADAVLISRCFIIYERSRWVIVFPVLLWLGGVLLTALQAYWQIVQSASILKAWEPVNMTVGPGTILMPFWASTIVLNGYATFMIVRRIYRVTKGSKASTGIRQLEFAMRIIIESGFLYVAVAIAHFVVWFTPNAYAISIISSINISVTGIAFNLILIRSARRRVEEIARVDMGPDAISGLQFNVATTKASESRFGVDIEPEMGFHRNDEELGSTTLDHGQISSITPV